MKKSIKTIFKKKGVEKTTMITAYDALFASLANEADIDIILTGDSVGNTVLGYESTVPVTIDDTVHHTAAVARAKPDSLFYRTFPSEQRTSGLIKFCTTAAGSCKKAELKL